MSILCINDGYYVYFNIVKELEKDNKDTSEKLNLSSNDYLTKNKNITAKLIGMVEDFVKVAGIL